MKVGKKQIDIREDNKSAVIEQMLIGEVTVPELEKTLLLSHTALNKIVNELCEQNIVKEIGKRPVDFGRPSKLFDINPDCAMAAAISITDCRLEIIYFDMKGFEINQAKQYIEYDSATELLDCIENTLNSIQNHYRIENRKVSTLCISLPAYNLFDLTIEKWKVLLIDRLNYLFIDTEIVFKKDIEFICIAEKAYGSLHDFHDNALLLNLENKLSFSVFSKQVNFSGIRVHEGNLNSLLSENFWVIVGREMPGTRSALIDKYKRGDPKVVSIINEALKSVLIKVKEIMACLDVPVLILCGDAMLLGESFQDFVQQQYGSSFIVKLSNIKDHSPSCAGAVWLATYYSIKKVIQRS